jgi:hypothetical protein
MIGESRFKMANGACRELIYVQVFERPLTNKKEIVCECCVKMKVDLNEVKLEVTEHQGDHVTLQEIPSKRKKLIILGKWEMNFFFFNYLQLNCLILVLSWPVFIDHQTVIFMNFLRKLEL